MRWWVVGGAFLVFLAGLGWQVVTLNRKLATYPEDISDLLVRDADSLARTACFIGMALGLVLFPMVLRGWRVAAGATLVVAMLYLGLGALLRGWPLIAAAVVVGAVAAVAIDRPTRSPATTRRSA
jgi:hypothetical protein